MEKTPKEEKKFLSQLDQYLNSNENENEKGVNHREKSDNLKRVAGFGVGLGSLYLQEALGYPFLVLRRQCQVNSTGAKYHVLPFSLFPVINRLQERQGFGALWKGWGSACIVKGITIATEVATFELFHIPRQDENQTPSGWEKTAVPEVMKGCTMLLLLPIFSASLIDSVQTLVLDQPRSVFSFLKDAVFRAIGLYSSRGHGRLLPFYSLILPSIVYMTGRYCLNRVLSYYFTKLFVNIRKKDKATAENMKIMYYTELLSSFFSCLVTDVIMYPFETCYVRLHLQGTRTVIDDPDKGYGVVPLYTNYTGYVDCLKSVTREEGVRGLFRGFGSLVLQYAVHFVIIKSTSLFYRSSGTFSMK